MRESIEYRGYTINVSLDECASNPWKDWDCEPPILVVSGRDHWKYGIDFELPTLTADDIRRSAMEIARTLGAKTLLRAVDRDYPMHSAVDTINEQLTLHCDGLSFSDQLRLIASAYQWKGSPAKTFGRTGYSQGDYAEILVVLTPDWIKKTGVQPERYAQCMVAAADLYAAYAFGDVYGYAVEDSDGEPISACWGYYGDPDDSGLLDDARGAIDFEIEERRKARQTRLKTFIRHRVPLEYRGAYL